jgi:uncharacterized membrane protein SpoIIM required for sporulation
MTARSALDDFVAARRPAWEELATLLRGRRLTKRPAQDISRSFELYREACTDLVRASRLGAAPTTLAYLDALVSRAHSQLYSGGGKKLFRFATFIRQAFPQALRENARLFWVASFLFWLPFGVGLWRSAESEAFSARVLPIEMLEAMANAYKGNLSDGRTAGANAAMAGFYVFNNVGIAFRCFATGILFGFGSAFFLVYNGLVTGAIVGHVIRMGGGPNILTFVCGHAPLELVAIVISGAAGLQMGRSLIITNGRTRLGSLWACREKILVQVLGAAGMLLLAAAIEGFWSPSPAPAQLKWAVGALLLVLVFLYLLFAGRLPSAAWVRPRSAGDAA